MQGFQNFEKSFSLNICRVAPFHTKMILVEKHSNSAPKIRIFLSLRIFDRRNEIGWTEVFSAGHE